VDNNDAIWRAFDNSYWPAHYFIDGQGRIRGHHFGEGHYDESEKIIQRLLAENGATGVAFDTVMVLGAGATAQADLTEMQSPETYLGYGKAKGVVSAGGLVEDKRTDYTAPKLVQLNTWALGGAWKVDSETAALAGPSGTIGYRFVGRDLHLVLGPGSGGRPVRFRVTLDGQPPGADHGVDTDAAGIGQVSGHRLYQLVRQTGKTRERVFQIEFLDPGVEAFAFTFG
jgi:hypothetical protein